MRRECISVDVVTSETTDGVCGFGDDGIWTGGLGPGLRDRWVEWEGMNVAYSVTRREQTAQKEG